MSQELWDLQKKFNDTFWATKGGWPKTAEERNEKTKEFILLLIKEVTEILDEINYKPHRLAKHGVDRANIMEEIIDTQKFLFGLAQLWSANWDEYADEFRRKSMVVEQRFEQEQSFAKLKHEQVVIVDIDGVLADYPRCFYEWLVEGELSATWNTEGMNPYRIQQKYESLPLDRKVAIKKIYRQSGAKKYIKLLPGAKSMMQILRSDPLLKIVLLTNRPYAEHYRIYPDTLEWLKTNEIPFDAILWAKDKGIEAVKYFSNVAWAIDDSIDNIFSLNRAGIEVARVDPTDPYRDTATFAEFLKELQIHKVSLSLAAHHWKTKVGPNE